MKFTLLEQRSTPWLQSLKERYGRIINIWVHDSRNLDLDLSMLILSSETVEHSVITNPSSHVFGSKEFFFPRQ